MPTVPHSSLQLPRCHGGDESAPRPLLNQPSPLSEPHYAPKHLAALEAERNQVAVLFADLTGSMELLADRDLEEARKPSISSWKARHRYEGTVNQVTGDGIMALFGAPRAHEDHAVRACYMALRMQQFVYSPHADG